ncbi:hypothetical protein [Gimibacter soli]|uniref:YfiR family protein n=1 Tax=Gimibacter soli TaxID=3024400 RepID=A0AAE9XU87_9PROT|nr:hypothetical protein [Gimibacter soli]WCL53613.1 hypothetical protein PH603_13825 [Gimibacter soli]
MLTGRLPHMLVLAALLLGAPAARADLTPTHVTVALKSARFLMPAPTPGDIAAIVYKEGDAASKKLAETLAASVDTVILTPKLTSTANPDFTRARLVFITDAALADIDRLSEIAKIHHVATIASKASCSQADKCVLTVETDPKTQIYLSIDAATAAGVTFSSAFTMLVRKH